MPGILREVVEHSLDILPNSKPVKQRLRCFDELKRRAIGEEVHKLLEARFIKEDTLFLLQISPWALFLA